MAKQLNFTAAEIDNLLDGRYNSFRESVQGDNSISLSANTETLYVNNGNTFVESTAPTYITSRWDTTNNKIAFPEEYDHPTYVVDMTPLFTPSAGSEGSVILRLYIDGSGTKDFSTDPVIRTYVSRQKGTGLFSIVGTWFLGTATGFDAKNNGVYFTIETENPGTLTNIFHTIYRT